MWGYKFFRLVGYNISDIVYRARLKISSVLRIKDYSCNNQFTQAQQNRARSSPLLHKSRRTVPVSTFLIYSGEPN